MSKTYKMKPTSRREKFHTYDSQKGKTLHEIYLAGEALENVHQSKVWGRRSARWYE